jgi:hypothetical protein
MNWINLFLDTNLVMVWKNQSKTVPLCHAGAKGESKHSTYSFLTLALDGVSNQHLTPATLYPLRKGPPVPTGKKAGWVSELVWTQMSEERFFASAGDRTLVIQSVVKYYTDWATTPPNYVQENSHEFHSNRFSHSFLPSFSKKVAFCATRWN